VRLEPMLILEVLVRVMGVIQWGMVVIVLVARTQVIEPAGPLIEVMGDVMMLVPVHQRLMGMPLPDRRVFAHSASSLVAWGSHTQDDRVGTLSYQDTDDRRDAGADREDQNRGTEPPVVHAPADGSAEHESGDQRRQ